MAIFNFWNTRELEAFANGLAEDLGRWLRGEPIHARPEHWAAKGKRLVRRHPALFTALAMFCGFLTLIVLTAARGRQPEELVQAILRARSRPA